MRLHYDLQLFFLCFTLLFVVGFFLSKIKTRLNWRPLSSFKILIQRFIVVVFNVFIKYFLEIDHPTYTCENILIDKKFHVQNCCSAA